MEKGDKLILNPDSDPISLGSIDSKIINNNTEYVIEYFDSKHITRGDGPESIHYWMMVKLRGIKDLQWLRLFKLKEK